MNYKRIYDELIERAKHRQLDGYTEKHRIVPGCMGGKYIKSNVVLLTPEEHYVAHQLLVKIYPDNYSLIYAAHMMTVTGNGHLRSNKKYGWLKCQHQKICKTRVGAKNPSYGRCWYYDPDTSRAGMFLEADVPAGWLPGKKKIEKRYCKICQNIEISRNGATCCKKCANRTDASLFIEENIDIIIAQFLKTGSITKTLHSFGFTGRAGNKKLSNILKEKGYAVLRRRNTPG